MNSPRLRVAIPSCNGREHLEPCLEALRSQDDPGTAWEIAIFDNGSDDGTEAWLERTHPDVKLIRSAENVGFARACNVLVEQTSAEAVALLNNDTRPRPDWLRHLVHALDHAPSDVVGLAGKVVDWDGGRLDFAGGPITFDGHAFQRDHGRALEDVRLPPDGTELLFGTGSNLLVRRADFLQLGGFDEDYFAYFEDVDFGWRAWAAGHRLLYVDGAIVHHRGGATSARMGDVRRGVLFERNAFLTAMKNYDDEIWPKILPVILMTMISRAGGRLSEGREDVFDETLSAVARVPAGTSMDRLRQIWRRVLFGLNVGPTNSAQMLAFGRLMGAIDRYSERREATQRRRRRSDAEILERFPPHVVPTYPGDRPWFASTTFREWLPAEIPFEFAELDQLMERR